MSEQLVAVEQKKPGLLAKIAAKYSVDPAKMMLTLKSTCFSVPNGEVSNEQMMMLLIVADQYNLNPFTKEIYAFPDKKNGVIPVVGVDGWAKLINLNPQFDGVSFSESIEQTVLEDGKKVPESMTCKIYRKDRSHPIAVTEYFDEVYQAPRNNYKGPWQTHPKRMLRHKVLIQCARLAFALSGIYDQDEADRFSGEVIVNDDALDVSSVSDINEKLTSDKNLDENTNLAYAQLMDQIRIAVDVGGLPSPSTFSHLPMNQQQELNQAVDNAISTLQK